MKHTTTQPGFHLSCSLNPSPAKSILSASAAAPTNTPAKQTHTLSTVDRESPTQLQTLHPGDPPSSQPDSLCRAATHRCKQCSAHLLPYDCQRQLLAQSGADLLPNTQEAPSPALCLPFRHSEQRGHHHPISFFILR